MAHLRDRSLRTTVVGTLLAVVCVVSAGKIWMSAEQDRPDSATATVTRVLFIERGERAALPEVTATFDLAGEQVEAVFADAERRLAAGDEFIIRYDPETPATAVPTWEAERDRGTARLVAGCLLVAGLMAAALARVEREATNSQHPTDQSSPAIAP